MSNWAKLAFNKGRVIGQIETIQRGVQEEKIMMDLHSEYMIDELRKCIDDLCDSVENIVQENNRPEFCLDDGPVVQGEGLLNKRIELLKEKARQGLDNTVPLATQAGTGGE